MSDNRETITDQELLETLRAMDSPVVSTTEIAEAEGVTISQGQILKRLKSLEERDRIGSKCYVAKPQIRLWWHKGTEFKRAWTSNDGITEEIGVEAVDVLDLPGRGEKLGKRREAVNAVFKFLFNVESGSKHELKFVGYGADMDTYADSDSLWNNCLKKALEQSPFYLLNKSKKNWGLSKLGMKIKARDNQPLWENWDENKQKIDELYHWILWTSLFESVTQFPLQSYSSYVDIIYENKDSNTTISYQLDLDGPAWSTSTGNFNVFLGIRCKSEDLETVLNNIDELTSDLERDFQIKDLTEDDSGLLLKCSYELNLEASEMLRQLDEINGGLILPLKRLYQWKGKTSQELIEVDKKVNQLII